MSIWAILTVRIVQTPQLTHLTYFIYIIYFNKLSKLLMFHIPSIVPQRNTRRKSLVHKDLELRRRAGPHVSPYPIKTYGDYRRERYNASQAFSTSSIAPCIVLFTSSFLPTFSYSSI